MFHMHCSEKTSSVSKTECLGDKRQRHEGNNIISLSMQFTEKQRKGQKSHTGIMASHRPTHQVHTHAYCMRTYSVFTHTLGQL